MSTLEKLKQKINESTSGNALNGLNNASKNFNVNNITKSLDKINSHFSLLGIAALKVKSSIVDGFLGMAKTLATTVPNIIKEGGWTRAMNIEQAKFMLEGLDVAWKDIAEDINYAVADTAYGLDSAAKAASQLVASNVKVGDSMKTALRAISGVAAMTNSEYDDIANVFTKVAGNGRLMGDDLQRLSARGMNAAATLSDYFKGVMNGSIEASDSVKAHIATITAQFGYGEAAIRDMVSKGQIDFATFAEAMDTTFGEHAKDANRTFMGVTQNLQAALKKIGALFATPILEQDGPVVQALNKLKDRIDDVRNSLGPLTKVWTEFVYRYAHDAKVLLQNMDMSFMKNVAQGLTNIFKSLVSVVDAVRYGFADIFLDSKGIKGIGDMAKAFSDFTAKLILSNSEMEDLRATIRGFLSVGDILVTIVKQILGAILSIKPESVNIREIILKITGTIGDLITYVAQLIKQTNIIEPAIKGISNVLNVLISLAAIGIDRIIALVSYISRLEIVPKIINSIETAVKVLIGGVTLLTASVIRLFNGGVKELPNILHKISTGLGEIVSWLSNIPIIDSAVDAVKRLTDAFMNLTNPKVKDDNGLVKTVTIVDDAVALAGPPIQKATKLEGAVNKLVVIKDKLVDFSKGVVTFIKNLDYGAIAAVAFTVAIAGIGYKLAQTMQAVSETFSATNNAINQVAGVIGSLKNRSIMELIFGKHEEPQKQSHFLLEFAAAIVAVAGSLKLLSTINSNKLEEVGIMLGKVGVGVAGLVTLLTILQKVLGKGEALAISSVLFSISGSIALMVAALAAATAIDYTNIQKAGAAIFQLSLVISGMTIALSALAPRISKGALSLIAMALSIKILIGALDTLAHLQIEARLTQLGGRKLWAKGGALVVLASGLVLVSGIASKLGTNSLIGIVAALLSLKMIIPLANSLAKQIQNSVFAEIWNKMVEFFVNIKTNHPKIWAGALAFLAITGIILSIVGAIKLIGKAISSIGGVFTGMKKEVGKFTGLQKALSRLALVPVIVALTGMMVAIGVMAVVIGKIKLPYLSQAIWIMAAISGIFLALAAVVKASRESKPTAIIGAMVGITMLFSELIVLTLLVEKHWAGMLVACAMMATIMHELSNVFDSLAEASEIGAKTLVAIGMIAGIVAELGGIMYLLSQQDWKSVAASGAAMSASMIAFANMITTIGSTGQSFTKNKFLAIAECAAVLPVIGASLTLAALSHDWAAILAAGGAMSAVMVAFGAMMQIVGKTKWNAGAWAAIGAIAVSAIAIGAALSIATLSHDWAAILAASAAMSLVMGVFGGMAILLGNASNLAASFAMMATVAVTAVAIGASLTMLTQYPWQDVLAAAGIMAGLMGVISLLAIGLGAIAPLAIPGAIALDLIAVAMLGVATSASMLLGSLTAFLPVADAFVGSVLGTLVGYSEQLPSTAVGLVELAGGLALVGAAGLALVLGAPGLISASIGLNLLVPACQGLKDVDLMPLAEGLAALVVPGLAMGLVGPAMTIGAAGLTAASIAIGLFSTALLGLSVSIPVALKAFDLIKQKAEEAKQWGSDLVQNFINGISKKLGKLREMASKMAQTIKDYIHFTKPDKGPLSDADTYGSDFVKLFTSSAEGEFPKLKNMASNMGSILKDGVSGIDMSSIGESLGIDLGSGAESGLTPFLNKIKSELASVRNQYATISKNGNVNRGAMAGGPSLLTQQLVEERKAARDAANANNEYSESAEKSGKSSSKAAEKAKELSVSFQAVERGAKVSLSSLVNSMADNYRETVLWAKDMKDLMGKGFDKSITDAIQKMGVGGRETVKAYLSASEEQIPAINALYKRALTLEEDAKKYIEGDYEEFTADIGAVISEGITAWNTQLEESVNKALDPFGEFDAKTELTSNKLLANMNSQLTGIRTWGDNLSTLVERGVNKGIIQHLIELGPKSYEQVNAMVNMTSEQLAEMNNIWDQQTQLGEEIALKFAEKMREIGGGVSEGFVAGIDFNAVSQSGTDIGTKVTDAAKTKLEINSPSHVFQRIGAGLPEGLGLGVRRNGHLAYTALIEMAQHCKDVTYKILNEEAGEEIGMFFMRGLARGIGSGKSDVINELESMANSVIEKAKQLFKINSPSKVFREIGLGLDEGLAQGIDRGTDMATSATSRLGNNTIQMMNDIIKNISADVNDSPELQPVIRPRLDLTALQNGKSRIGSMLDNPAYEMATSVAANMVSSTVNAQTAPSQIGNTQNIIINQTNNSPKALDAYDIYRNTRNLVPQLQGALS